VEQLAGDFDPSGFEDRYRVALEAVIEAKVSAGGTQPVPAPADGGPADGTGQVVDLLAALQRSVEKARSARGETGPADAEPAEEKATGTTGRAPAKPGGAPKRGSKAASTTNKPAARTAKAKAD
jgi:DNA end-binding protein Ku